MKKWKVLSGITLAIASLMVVSCSKNAQSSSTSQPSTTTTSNSSGNGGGTQGSALEKALAKDYSNATMVVEVVSRDLFGDIAEEAFVEINFDGYTIIQTSDDGETNQYMYYHDYQDESYLYFEDKYGNGDAWLNYGYKDSPLGIEHTYFTTKTLSKLDAKDAYYSFGSYLITDEEIVKDLDLTMFYFAWFNTIDYVSIMVQDDTIYRIMGLSEGDDDVFVRITFGNVGTTSFAGALPPIPDESNVKTYYEWSGTSPIVDVPIASLNVDFVGDTNGTIELEETIEIKRTYLPENATDTIVKWYSKDPSIASIGYSFTFGQAVVTGISAGTTEVYAIANSGVESNHLTITVKPVASSSLENCLYEFRFDSLNGDNSVNVVNQLSNGKTATAKANKALMAKGSSGNNDIYSAEDNLFVLNPSIQGGDIAGSYIEFDFGLQQVSGISFHYGLQWSSDISNLNFISQAEIQTSEDGETWETAANVLDELKANLSSKNAKLLETEFAPTTHVRFLIKSNMIGRQIRVATTLMNFYANKDCQELEPPVEEIKVTSIAIATPSKTTLFVDETLELTATILPEDATNKTIVWESSNPNVASVNQLGVVSALSEGTTTISAKNLDGTIVSNFIELTIVNKTIEIPSSMVGTWSGEDIYGSILTIVITQDGTLTLEGQTFSVASFEEVYKKYTFVNENDEEIIVSMPSGYTNLLNVECFLEEIYISASQDDGTAFKKVVPVTSVSIYASKTTLDIDDVVTLTASTYPNDATEGTKLTWASSDPSVASITSQGKVTALKEGTTQITATSANGVVSNTIEITVNAPITGGDVTDIADIVGTWQNSYYDYDVGAETVTLLINEDGTAILNDDYNFENVELTFVNKEDNVYNFVDNNGNILMFMLDGEEAYLYYGYDYVEFNGSVPYTRG